MCFMYAVNKFNLIGEGIFMLSACMVTWVSLSLQNLNLPAVVMVPLMYIVAILTGVVMALYPRHHGPQVQRQRGRGIPDAQQRHRLSGHLDPAIRSDSGTPTWLKEIPKSVQLPGIFGKFRVQSGLIVAIICVIIIAVLFYKTSFGWKMRLVGANSFCQGGGLSALGISFAAQ